MKTILNSVKTALLYTLLKPIELVFDGLNFLFASLIPDIGDQHRVELHQIIALALGFILAAIFFRFLFDSMTIAHALSSAADIWVSIRSILPVDLSVMYIVCPAILGTSYILTQSGSKSLDHLRSGHTFHYSAQIIAWFPELIAASTFVLTCLYVSAVETFKATLSMRISMLAVAAANPVAVATIGAAYVSIVGYDGIRGCFEAVPYNCKNAYSPESTGC